MTQSAETRRVGDRRHASVSEVVSIIMLVLQFGALVWGASALKSSVDALGVTVSSLSQTLEKTQSATNALTVDVGILKDRISIPRTIRP